MYKLTLTRLGSNSTWGVGYWNVINPNNPFLYKMFSIDSNAGVGME